MPEKNNKRKYADIETYMLFQSIFPMANAFYTETNEPEKHMPMATTLTSFHNYPTMKNGKQVNVKGITLVPSQSEICDDTNNAKYLIPELENECRDHIRSFHNDLGNFIENHDKKFDNFMGTYKFMYAFTDIDSEHTINAYLNNKYISRFKSLMANSMRFSKYGYEGIEQGLGDEVDPETGKKIPLTYINDFFENSAKVFELEKKLQQYMTEERSDEKEAQYRNELISTYDKMVSDYEKFYEFGLKHVDPVKGTSKYDDYMCNPFDMFFGISINAHKDAPRNPKEEVEWLRGKSVAAKNGWDISELDAVAGIYSLAHRADVKYREFLKDYPSEEAVNSMYNAAHNRVLTTKQEIEQLKQDLNNTTDPTQQERLKHTLQTKQERLETNYVFNEKKYDDIRKNYKKTKAGLEAFKNDTQKLKEDVEKTKVRDISDKARILSSINSFCKNPNLEKDYNITLNSSDKKSLKIFNVINDPVTDQVVKARDEVLLNSRKPAALPDDTVDENFLQMQEGYYAMANGLKFVQARLFEDIKPELATKYPEMDDEHPDGLGNPIAVAQERGENTTKFYSPIRFHDGNCAINVAVPEDGNRWREMVADIHDEWVKYNMNLPEEDKIFKPYNDVIGMTFDIKNGSYLKANNDNYILHGMATNISAGPAIHRKQSSPNYVSHAEIKNWMDENGVTEPLMNFYNGIGALLQTEYDKQRSEKTGWNAQKEKQYFENLTNAYEKIIDSFDKLSALPDEVQDSTQFLDNSIGHMTGKGTNINNRDMAAYVNAMKWELQAMKNGWKKEDLPVISSMGMLEGLMDKRIDVTRKNIQKLEAEKEQKLREHKDVKDIEQKIASGNRIINDLNELKAKEFGELKNKLLTTKVKGPGDVVSALNAIDRFHQEKGSSIGFLGGEISGSDPICDKVYEGFKPYRDMVSNRVIKELKAANDLKRGIKPKDSPGTYYPAEQTAPVKAEKTDARDFILDGIMKLDKLDRLQAENYVSQYIKNSFEMHMLDSAHPELVDNKNPGYRYAQAALNAECSKYAKNFLDSVKPETKPGEPVVYDGSKLADQIKCGGHEIYFNEMQDKVTAALRVRNSDLFLNGTVTAKIKNPETNATTTEKFSINNFIKRGCDELDKGDTGFWSTSSKYRSITNSLKNLKKEKENIDNLINAKQEELSQDPDKYMRKANIPRKKFADFYKKCMETENSIKSYLQAKKNKQETTGLKPVEKKHFDAMKEAYRSIRILRKQTGLYRNNGPSVHDRKLAEAGYNTNADFINKNLANELKNVRKETKNLSDKMKTFADNEFEKRSALGNNLEANRNELVTSAQKDLYLGVLKNSYAKQDAGLLQTIKNNRKLGEALNEYEKGEQFNRFKEECFDKNPSFKANFEQQLMQKARKSTVLSHNDMIYCRDTALKHSMREFKDNPQELEAQRRTAKMMGSGVEPVPEKAMNLDKRLEKKLEIKAPGM